MVTFYQQSSTQEQERILATFRAGHAMCQAAFSTFLHAIATFLLALVHIFTSVVNFTIGVLMIVHALGCMARILLVQWQEQTANPLNTVEGRAQW